LPFLADQIALRHAHVLEKDLRGVGGAHAEFVELARDLDAFGFHRHANQRFVLVNPPVGGVGEKAHPVGLRAIRGPHLAAVDDVIAAILAGRGFDGGDVRPGADFGDPQTGDVVSGDRGREKFAAHAVRAEPGERGRRHIGMHANRHRHAAAFDGAKLLGHHHGVGIVEALSAIFNGLVETEKSKVAHLLEELMRRKDAGLLPFVDMRIYFGGDEFLQAAAQLLVLGRELHDVSSFFLVTYARRRRCCA
jgi:hypothetical protein